MHPTKSHGFTLIELMIVVVIVGILAAIAFPSYQESVKKTRRSDAHNALSTRAALQERWFTQNNSYTTVIANIGGATSDEGYYNIAVANPGGAGCNGAGGQNYCYTLTATPVAGGPQAGDGLLTLDHTGRKGWDENNDGDTTDANEDNWTKN